MTGRSSRGDVKVKRERAVDEMWSRIDPLMHRRHEEAMDRRTG
ncbi:MAG: hypothetical protein SV186_07115 [Candidatus Nanohaloarchaea archaeon]|nr:hypothetical protein [Candidatus Nanohaloarchaea archaeon]